MCFCFLHWYILKQTIIIIKESQASLSIFCTTALFHIVGCNFLFRHKYSIRIVDSFPSDQYWWYFQLLNSFRFIDYNIDVFLLLYLFLMKQCFEEFDWGQHWQSHSHIFIIVVWILFFVYNFFNANSFCFDNCYICLMMRLSHINTSKLPFHFWQ